MTEGEGDGGGDGAAGGAGLRDEQVSGGGGRQITPRLEEASRVSGRKAVERIAFESEAIPAETPVQDSSWTWYPVLHS